MMNLKMKVKKSSALIEASVNTVVGIILSIVFTQVICWMFDIVLDVDDNAIISIGLTVISFIRQYVIRKLFEENW